MKIPFITRNKDKVQLKKWYTSRSALAFATVFALIGVAMLFRGFAATPLTIDSSLPVPQNVKAWGDDQNIIVSWDNIEDNRVVGYYLRYRPVGSSAWKYRQTTFSLIQLQPVENGVEYEIVVQSAAGSMQSTGSAGPLVHAGSNNWARANGNVSNQSSVVKSTPTSARVDSMRERLTGFFDDFNQPAGPFDESKWNQGSSACIRAGTAAAFLNSQFHTHNMVKSTCDRAGYVSRPRGVLDKSGATAENPIHIEFDMDGATNNRDVWYIDLIPMSARKNGYPIDITSHNDLFDQDNNDPGNMVRISQTGNSIGVHHYNSIRNTNFEEWSGQNSLPFERSANCDSWFGGVELSNCNWSNKTPGLSPIPETTANISPDGIYGRAVPNVRRHWVIQIYENKLKIFIDSVYIGEATLTDDFVAEDKLQIHQTIFSYNTGKEARSDGPVAYSMLWHWDNFGFSGPPQEQVIHNYMEGGSNGSTPVFGTASSDGYQIPNGNRTTIIPIPDEVGDLVDDKGALYMTFAKFSYGTWRWKAGDHLLFNGVRYDIPNPATLVQYPYTLGGCVEYTGTTQPFAFAIPIDKAHIRQGGNVVEFKINGQGGDCGSYGAPSILNVHLELPYAASDPNIPEYSKPLQVFGSSFRNLVEPAMTNCDQYLFVEQDLGLPYESGKGNLEIGQCKLIEGHNPAGNTPDPDPILCEDPNATNIGNPIPCEYPAPADPPDDPDDPDDPDPSPTTPLDPATSEIGTTDWTDVTAGSNRQPTITIDQNIYPNSSGVQFLINGTVDVRDSGARPNGYDATGPNEGSLYHMYPPFTLNDGDELDARWTDQNGTIRRSVYTVGQSGQDTTNPTVSITNPTSNQTVSNTITIETTATDNVAVQRVSYYLDDSSTAFSNDSSAPYETSWNSASVSNGTHTIKAIATDTSGNTAETTVTIDVQNTTPDTEAPTTNITSPDNNDEVEGTIFVLANASDNVGVSKVELLIDGQVAFTDITAPYSYALDTNILADRDYELRTRAYDSAGNNTYSDIVSITVDNILEPEPVCEELSANNVGQPLPCTFDPDPEPTTKPGDVNNDGKVDRDDLRIVLFFYTSSVAKNTNGDLDGDSKVTRDDLRIVLYYYAKGD